MAELLCLRAGVAPTLSELLQRETRGENRRPLRPLSRPPRVSFTTMPHFRSPEDLVRYLEGVREKESFAQLFDRIEREKRDRRVRIAEAARRELRRNARRVQREILWRKLPAACQHDARRLGLASDTSY